MGAVVGQPFKGKGRNVPSGFDPSIGALTVSQSIYEQSTVRKHNLGDRLQIGNRVFYYALAGAANLAAGKLCESARYGGSSATAQMAIAVPSASDNSNKAGQPFVTLTLATDAATLDQFADGYFSVYDKSGASYGDGQTYRIKHSAVTGAGGAILLELYDDLVIALTAATTTCSIVANEYSKVIVNTAYAEYGFPVGIPLIAVTATEFFWIQTWGPCTCLAAGNWVLGTALVIGNTAGSLAPQVATTGSLQYNPIGYAMDAVQSTYYGLAFLQISA